jgi:hypothetical protein
MARAPESGVAINPNGTQRLRAQNKHLHPFDFETARYGSANYKMKISNFVSKSPTRTDSDMGFSL